MKFRIAKPSNHMSFGDLFYSLPSEETEKQAMAELRYLCEEKCAKREQERVNNELEAIEETGNAMGVLILYEIADISKELGYPTALYGMESGLYIMELLGISNLSIQDYEYSQTPSEMCTVDLIFGKSYTFTLAIAEPVREHIQSRLNERFGHMECNNELYRNISLPNWTVLDKIGKLSEKTKVPYEKVEYNSQQLLEDLFYDICENDINQKTYLKRGFIPSELARLYAFARCNRDEDVLFSDVRDYVFRDDIYECLREDGAFAHEAFRLSINRTKGGDLPFLKQYNLPVNLFYCYEVLGNLWGEASCLARVNALAILKFYELNYPDLYTLISEEES